MGGLAEPSSINKSATRICRQVNHREVMSHPASAVSQALGPIAFLLPPPCSCVCPLKGTLLNEPPFVSSLQLPALALPKETWVLVLLAAPPADPAPSRWSRIRV